jgi:hypothetical protein
MTDAPRELRVKWSSNKWVLPAPSLYRIVVSGEHINKRSASAEGARSRRISLYFFDKACFVGYKEIISLTTVSHIP